MCYDHYKKVPIPPIPSRVGYQPFSNVDTSDPPGGVTLKDEIREHIKRIDKVYQSVPINGERAIECLKAKSTALLALSNLS